MVEPYSRSGYRLMPMRSFYIALLRHRFVALAVLLAVTVAFGQLLVDPARLRIDFSLDALLVPDNAARADLQALHADFGDDVGMVAVVVALPRDGVRTVFDGDVLAAIDRLGAWLRARPEVDADGVVTLLDLPDLRQADIQAEALRAPNAGTQRSLLAHRSFGELLSADAKSTLVVAPFAVHAPDLRAPLLDDLAIEVTRMGAGIETHLVGVPLVQMTYARVALRDIVLLVPVTIVVIALLLGIAFRRRYAVVGPLAGVGLATVWTLGLIQALGLPFDMVNSVSGVVILVVGVAEGAHIVARHREEVTRGGTPLDAILRTMHSMVPACFVTSATTAVGFASLATARLPAIESFGLVLAAGVMMAWAIQMVLMPIVLSFTVVHAEAQPLGDGMFGGWLDRIADVVFRQPKAIALIGLVTAVVAGIGALQLHADARAAGELQSDHPVARGLATMEDRLSGVLVHAIALTGKAGGACVSDADCAPRGPRSAPVCKRVDRAYAAVASLRHALTDLTGSDDAALFTALDDALHSKDLAPDGTCTETVTTPDVIAFLRDVQAWVDATQASTPRAQRLVSRATSIYDLLVDLGRGASPEGAAIGERIAILEGGAPALVGRYLTPDHTRTQLVLRANDIGLAAWRAFEPELRAEIAEVARRHGLGERVDIVVTGGATLAEKAISGIATDLVDSVFYDFLLILAFIVGLVRNLRLGLLAMIPNLWPLVITLGMMGYLDLPIRASTIIVFSVALGIAVDDTTHFVHRYREEVQALGEGPEAVRRTLLATGRPIVLTSIILVAGFLVNGLSDFMAIVEFGLLSAVTLGLALVAELFLTPALLLLCKGRLGKL